MTVQRRDVGNQKSRSRLRILHVVPTYQPAWRYGGTIRSVHGLCKAMADRGHVIEVATTTVNGSSDLFPSQRTDRNVDGVNVHYFRADRSRRLYWSSPMAQFFSEGMPGFDVVHVHAVFLWPTWAAARRARLHSVPHIIAPRGMLVGDLIRARGQLKKAISIALFDKRALQSADAVHFTTKREKSDCEALGIRPRHSITIPNGIDLDSVPVRYRHSNPPEIGRSYVLYLGRISWKKGIDRLVRAMADLPNSHLVIAGNDDENYTEHLRSVARDCNVSDRIEFRGHVGGEQKWELLAMASVLALPSISENFGNVIIEALSVGTPVVTTEGVGLAETVRESGTGIVSGPEPANIARSIQEILSNTNAGRLMGDAGRKLVASRFTWSVVAARMETAYLDLVDSNSAAVSREVAGTVSR